MKKSTLTFFALLIIFGALFFVSPMMTASAQVAPARDGDHDRDDRRGHRERHPKIKQAINALERARIDLQDASHTFCGHREEALEATNQAIVQLRLALQFDRASIESLNVNSTVKFTNAMYDPAGMARYPNIHKAINALERAKDDLQHAAHDFGGHRVDAIRATDTALAQLRQAITCANERREEKREKRS